MKIKELPGFKKALNTGIKASVLGGHYENTSNIK